MAKPHSVGLSERVVGAVEKGGLSRREAASQFGVGISTGIAWVRRFGATGSMAPGQMGAGTSRRRSGASITPGSWHGSGRRTSPCMGWWPSSPRAASRPIIGRCGTSFTPRS